MLFFLGFQDAAAELQTKALRKGGSTLGRALYLDMQATTPVDPRVLDVMMPLMTEQCDETLGHTLNVCRYGNAHSRTHMYGWEAEEFVEDARKKVADLLSADSKEIIFTSGATESNNIAIKGVARFHKDKKKHLITTVTVRATAALFMWPKCRRSTSASSTRAEHCSRRALRSRIFLCSGTDWYDGCPVWQILTKAAGS